MARLAAEIVQEPTRLVLVSNRVPRPGIRAASGLESGVLDAVRGDNLLWFGCGTVSRSTAAEGGVFETLGFAGSVHDLFYRGFCNSVLWPLLHGMPERVRRHAADFATYRLVNQRLAKALVQRLQQNDRIWVHDYHLLPLGAELRRLGVRQRLGFYLHVPFPGARHMASLPELGELLQALTAYDVIGVQTRRDRTAMKSALGRAATDVVLAPVSVDVERVRRAAEGKGVASLLGGVGAERLIVGIDRLDYTKGLLERLRGFAALLENDSSFRRRVGLLQIVAPCRAGVAGYQEYWRSVRRNAQSINARWATREWTPIRLVRRTISRSQAAALLRRADVGLVTPLVDGMNLIAKEFIAVQDPLRPAPLVLSKLAGAFAELDHAIGVDPTRPNDIARGLDVALRLSIRERRVRHRQLLNRLEGASARTWQSTLDSALSATAKQIGSMN